MQGVTLGLRGLGGPGRRGARGPREPPGRERGGFWEARVSRRRREAALGAKAYVGFRRRSLNVRR